jgi:hypothetical protein
MASQVKFEFEDVNEKEKRRYKKGSKYDPIIDAYLISPKYKAKGDGLQKLEPKDEIDSSYLSLQIKKRIVIRELPIKVSVSNGIIYFEKVQ